MRTSLVFTLALGLFFCSPFPISLTGPVAAQDRPNHTIELFDGRFDDAYVKTLTIDKITDKLGRPSSVEDGIQGITGPTLKYHPIGLQFSFDTSGHFYAALIYLSQSWDAKSVKHFEPFAGNLSPDVSGNTKGESIMASFSTLTPLYKSAEQRLKEWEAEKIRMRPPNFDDVISIQFAGHSVNFILEKNTKFLERVSIIRK